MFDTVYRPPAADADRSTALLDDPWIAYTQYALWFCGGAYVLLGVGFALFMPSMFSDLAALQPTPEADAMATVMGIYGVVAFVICAVVGGANFAAAYGLGRGAKWAWIMTLVIGAMYAPSACFPFGLVLLYGMLNERTRKLFLG